MTDFTILQYFRNNDFTVKQRIKPNDMNWKETVDDMLTVCFMVASNDPRESINRLIEWHVQVALDPSVSTDAKALVDHTIDSCIEVCKELGKYVKPGPMATKRGMLVTEAMAVGALNCAYALEGLK